MLQFLEDIHTGNVLPHIRSEPRPVSDRHPLYPSLIKVAASSFRELVLECPTAVLLLVREPGNATMFVILYAKSALDVSTRELNEHIDVLVELSEVLVGNNQITFATPDLFDDKGALLNDINADCIQKKRQS